MFYYYDYYFRKPSEKEIKEPEYYSDAEPGETETDSEEFLLCAECSHIITSPKDAITVNGQHEYTFANPHGYIFNIGCFKFAQGCSQTGAPTSEFTWFKGYLWRLGVCSKCLCHLGWIFLSKDDNFYGLILDRLIKSE